MARRVSKRALWINLVGLISALLIALIGFSGRAFQGVPDAFAAAPTASAAPAPSAAASAAPIVGAAPTPSASAAPAAPASAEPIDLAVAPNGGVPTHPSGTPYKSPFAKPNADKAVKIKVGILLNSIDDYDVKTGTFLADFFLSFTSETPMPELSPQFPNGRVDATKIIADKPTFKLMRLSGQFKSPADLRNYPYDSQALKILIEDDTRGVDQMRFVVDKERTKTARGFRAVGWQVAFVEARSLSHSYPDRFENDDLYYGRYVFTIGLDRFAASAVFKVYVPAFVIVLISLLGMWVPPGLDGRSVQRRRAHAGGRGALPLFADARAARHVLPDARGQAHARGLRLTHSRHALDVGHVLGARREDAAGVSHLALRGAAWPRSA